MRSLDKLKIPVQFVERVMLPRCQYGIDHGTQRLLLAQYNGKQLFWSFAHMAWKSRLEGRSHVNGSLILAKIPSKNSKIYWGAKHTKIHEGGRLSEKLIKSYSTKIDEYFGIAGLSDRIWTKMTLLIGKQQ